MKADRSTLNLLGAMLLSFSFLMFMLGKNAFPEPSSTNFALQQIQSHFYYLMSMVLFSGSVIVAAISQAVKILTSKDIRDSGGSE